MVEIETYIADKDISVLCITEHWLSEDEAEAFQITNYTMVGYSTRQDSTGVVQLYL